MKANQVLRKEQKSHEELEATQNVEKVKEHLMAKEIKKLVEGSENVEENVEVSSSPLRNDDNQCNPDTRLEPISENESPKVEKITDISQHVNVIKEEEESTEDDYELKRREKGNHVEEIRNTPSPTRIRSPRTHYNLISLDTKKLQELAKTDTIPSSSTPSSSSLKSKLSNTNRLLSLFKSKPGRFKRYKSFFQELQGRYGYLFEHLLARFMPKRNFNKFAQRLQEIMLDSLPKLVDDRNKGILKTQVPLHVDSSVRSYISCHVLHVHLTQATPTNAQEQQHQLYLTKKDNPQLQHDDLPIWLALKYKFERLHMATTPWRPFTVRPRDQDDPYDDAHVEGENSAKGHKTSEHGTFVFSESSSGQDYENDDVLPNKKVSKELIDEMSQTVYKAKLHKVVNEILRQQCTLGNEHQYYIDQMQNFLKSDIIWESRKEIIILPYQPEPTLVV
nr:hypothetical protein [Tanacetum cinerariifolium]